jgi:ribosomal protein S18 acetylase RimI-like enzyme
MEPVLRAAKSDDLASVLKLWREAEAEPSHTDDIESLRRLIAHDPGALIVAATDGHIVGSVIAGWDGWRGSIYRLAVAPSHRRRGLGTRLLGQAEGRLAQLGARRLQAIVVSTDERASAFWAGSDWELQSNRARYVKG